MQQYWVALGFATLPMLGNIAGGLIAEYSRLSRHTLSVALHFSAGIILAVVGTELMDTALEANRPWVIALTFLLGGGFAVLLDKSIDYVKCRFGGKAAGSGPWMIYAGVAVDLFSDGVMIGTGSTISSGLALLLALGQVTADIPEGFATIATFKKQNLSRAIRMLITVSFVLPILIGTSIGYWAVRDAPDLYKFALLSFTGGILLTIAVEEMLAQAHDAQEGEETSGQTISLAAGFALFILMSSYVG